MEPYYQSERCFRKYEAILGEAVRAFPKVITKNPANYGMRPTTFVARLRDAKKAFHDNPQWSTALIDRSKLLSIYPEFVISFRKNPENLVKLGPKNELEPPSHSFTTLPTEAQTAFPVLFGDDTRQIQIRFLGYLAHHRLLSQPVQIILHPYEAVDLDTLYDLDLNPVDNLPNTYILT